MQVCIPEGVSEDAAQNTIIQELENYYHGKAFNLIMFFLLFYWHYEIFITEPAQLL